ncbi:hypothetical protein B0T11DRAFT_315719 [Plectosphaerella cucumerina]|uniref:Uncharacterized protein n=1 Tax=Plectosphaerella cucumerina TaxID=40658 RepID=A0A8K0X6T0_9PEZI|nr:hypothetical protein B0T11DRAFT_315719 [Plectosphaerella cucumerina]
MTNGCARSLGRSRCSEIRPIRAHLDGPGSLVDLVATQGIRELKPARCAASGMDILVSGTSRDVKRPDVARVADISACVLAERLCGCWGQKEVVTNGWPRRGNRDAARRVLIAWRLEVGEFKNRISRSWHPALALSLTVRLNPLTKTTPDGISVGSTAWKTSRNATLSRDAVFSLGLNDAYRASESRPNSIRLEDMTLDSTKRKRTSEGAWKLWRLDVVVSHDLGLGMEARALTAQSAGTIATCPRGRSEASQGPGSNESSQQIGRKEGVALGGLRQTGPGSSHARLDIGEDSESASLLGAPAIAKEQTANPGTSRPGEAQERPKFDKSHLGSAGFTPEPVRHVGGEKTDGFEKASMPGAEGGISGLMPAGAHCFPHFGVGSQRDGMIQAQRRRTQSSGRARIQPSGRRDGLRGDPRDTILLDEPKSPEALAARPRPIMFLK